MKIDVTPLFLVFLILKLTGVINWSWWWVTSPLWLPFAFIAVVVVIAAILAAIVAILESF
jgi:hypothetical protein